MQNPLQGILAQFIRSVSEDAQRRAKPPGPPRGVPSPGLGAGSLPAPRNNTTGAGTLHIPTWTPPNPVTPPAPPPPPPNRNGSGTVRIPELVHIPEPDIIGGLGNIKDNIIPTAGALKDDPGGTLGSAGSGLIEMTSGPQRAVQEKVGDISFRIANLDDKAKQVGVITTLATEMAQRMSPGLNNPVTGGSEMLPDWRGLADGLQNFFTWSVANKDVVNEAHRNAGGSGVIAAFKEDQGGVSNFLFDIGTDPLNLASGAGGLARGTAARMAPGIARDALAGVGGVLSAPDLATDAALGLVGKGVGAGARQAGKTRVGATIVKAFDTDARTKATTTRNAVMRAIRQEDQAGVITISDPIGAPAPGVRPADAAAPVAANDPSVYISSPRKARTGSTERAGAAHQARIRSAAGDNEAARLAADAEVEDEIAFRMGTKDAPSDVQTNPAEWWRITFDAESAARKAGGNGPHLNNHVDGSIGYYLDELAWNPDPAARTNALDALKQKGLPSKGDEEALNEAIDLAQNNPYRKGAAAEAMNPPTAPATPSYDVHWDLIPDADKDLLDFGIKTPGPWQPHMRASDAYMRIKADTMMRTWDEIAAGRMGVAEGEAAEMAFRDASSITQRMLEGWKRKADYAYAYSLRNGTPLGPDYQAFLKMSDELDRTVSMRGFISDESEDLLNQTFNGTNAKNAGRTFRDVARETRDTIRQDKLDLEQLLLKRDTPGVNLDPKEAKRLQELLNKYPFVTNANQAMKMNVDKLWGRQLTDEFRDHFDVKEINRFWRGVDTLTSNFSTLNLLAPWSVARYYIGNLAGDTLQVGMKLGLDDALGMNFGEAQKVMMDYAVRGGNPLDSALGDLYLKFDLGGFNPGTVDENLTEAIFDRGNGAMRRAGGRSTFNVNTRMADWAYFKQMRNISNGLEWGRRTGLHGSLFEKNVLASRADYVRENMETIRRAGLDSKDAEEIMGELGTRFSGSDAGAAFGRRAMEKGATKEQVEKLTNEMGRKWANKINVADKEALKSVNSALFSYETKNIDVWARRFIPFHMWATRALPFYAEQGMRNPGLINAYYGLMQETQRQAEEQNWPDSLKTYQKFWEGPGGIMLMFNPIAAVGLMDLALFHQGGENPYDEKNAIQNALAFGEQFGLGLAPIWKATLDYAGLLGDGPATDPFGFYQAYNFMRTQIQNGLAQGWLGDEWRGTLVGRPWEEVLANLRDITSGFTSSKGIGEHIPAAYVEGGDLRKIHNQMIANEVAGRGMTMDQYWWYVIQAQGDPQGAEAQWLDEIHQAVADEYADAGEGYLRAVVEVSEGEAGAALWKAILPGPKTVRQETSLDIQSIAGAADPYLEGGASDVSLPGLGLLPDPHKGGASDILNRIDPFTLRPITAESLAAHPEQLDARDRAFLTNWVKMFGHEYRKGDVEKLLRGAQDINRLQNLTPEAATITRQDAARDSLGSPKEQRLLKEYNRIGYGERPVRIKKRDIDLTAEELSAQDSSTRWAVADAWLAEHDPDGEVKRLKDARNLYVDTHPELAAFEQWKRGSSKDWGSAAAYRAYEVKANPNYAAYIDRQTSRLRQQGKSPSEIEEQLNTYLTFTPEAFFAYQGNQWGIYDPAAIDTGQPSSFPPGSVSDMGSGGSGGYSERSGNTWEDRVRTAVQAGHAARLKQVELYGRTIDSLHPTIAASVRNEAPPEALEPEDDWIYREYLEFFHLAEARGQDSSIEAYIASTSRDRDEGKLSALAGQ